MSLAQKKKNEEIFSAKSLIFPMSGLRLENVDATFILSQSMATCLASSHPFLRLKQTRGRSQLSVRCSNQFTPVDFVAIIRVTKGDDLLRVQEAIDPLSRCFSHFSATDHLLHGMTIVDIINALHVRCQKQYFNLISQNISHLNFFFSFFNKVNESKKK